MLGTEPEFHAWLVTRPAAIQRLAAEFPPSSIIVTAKGDLYLLGWTEGEQLIVSRVDPAVDYEGAGAGKQYICAQHLREHVVEIRDRTE